MNKFKKYCPNVWVAECDEEYEKGEIIGQLEKATAYHQGLKDGTIERRQSFSLTYAKKDVNELKKKVEIAELLWGTGKGE